MEWFRWERNPWGQEILIGLSWDLIWVAVAAGALLIAAHALLYSWRWRGADAGTISETLFKQLPEKILRHSVASRLFHWVMAASVLTLVFTAFLPIWGVKFSWVTAHWIAGLVLTAAIIFHIIHASLWKGLSLMWINSQELSDGWLVIKQVLGSAGPGARKAGEEPAGKQALSSRRGNRHIGSDHHRLDHDGQSRHPMVEAQPLYFVRRHLGDHLRCSWGGQRRSYYPRYGPLLFRRPTREALDHSFHAARLDLSRALP
jgi:hypothetical protein